jgi:hypothetical protein
MSDTAMPWPSSSTTLATTTNTTSIILYKLAVDKLNIEYYKYYKKSYFLQEYPKKVSVLAATILAAKYNTGNSSGQQ